MEHEKTQAHKDAVQVLVSWVPDPEKWGRLLEPTRANNWGLSFEPYQRLCEDVYKRPDPLEKRVGRWMRGMARAEGLEVESEEEDEPEFDFWPDCTTTGNSWGLPPHDWTVPACDWHAQGGDWKLQAGDWKRPPTQWTIPVDPLANAKGGDPRPAADYKFVEKVAKMSGLTKERRRLHAFFRVCPDCVSSIVSLTLSSVANRRQN